MSVSGQIKQFPSIPAPPGHDSAGGGDLPPVPGGRKRLYVDLGPSRFVGCVRDPTAIGRELALAFAERGLHIGLRFAGRALGWNERKYPKVAPGLRIFDGIENKPAITGPIGWALVEARLQQRLLLANPAG